MDDKILVAPERREIGDEQSVFLAGSIQGAVEWQSEAVMLLRQAGFGGWIFNPRRPAPFPEDETIWLGQVNWERDHLKKATVIIFWLPAGADGLTSRWEMAEFAAKGKKLVVGVENGVRGKRYIEYVLKKEYAGNAIICSSLRGVCETVAEKICKKIRERP